MASRPAGTLLTAELALQHGLAVNTAGGTHHAFPGHGSGFCILNDLAVTALELLRRGSVHRVLVFDLDVHHAPLSPLSLVLPWSALPAPPRARPLPPGRPVGRPGISGADS